MLLSELNLSNSNLIETDFEKLKRPQSIRRFLKGSNSS